MINIIFLIYTQTIFFFFLVILDTLFVHEFVLFIILTLVGFSFRLISGPDSLADMMFSLESNSSQFELIQLQQMIEKRQIKRRPTVTKQSTNITILSVVNGSISWFSIVRNGYSSVPFIFTLQTGTFKHH